MGRGWGGRGGGGGVEGGVGVGWKGDGGWNAWSAVCGPFLMLISFCNSQLQPSPQRMKDMRRCPSVGREEGRGSPGTCLVISQLMVAPLYLEVQGFLTFSQNQHLLRTSLVSKVLSRVSLFSAFKTQQGCILVTVRKGTLREASCLSKK